MLILDPKAQRTDGFSPHLGELLICFGCAVAGAIYFIINERNVKQFPICLLIFYLNFVSFILSGVIAKIMTPGVEFFSTDPNYGLFGFLSPDLALFMFGPYGILCCFFGSAGYVICLLFYSPVVTANSYLLEPFIAQALGYFLGLDSIPGLLTFLGTLLTVVGIFALQKGAKDRKKNQLDNESEGILTSIRFSEKSRATYSVSAS